MDRETERAERRREYIIYNNKISESKYNQPKINNLISRIASLRDFQEIHVTNLHHFFINPNSRCLESIYLARNLVVLLF